MNDKLDTSSSNHNHILNSMNGPSMLDLMGGVGSSSKPKSSSSTSSSSQNSSSSLSLKQQQQQQPSSQNSKSSQSSSNSSSSSQHKQTNSNGDSMYSNNNYNSSSNNNNSKTLASPYSLFNSSIKLKLNGKLSKMSTSELQTVRNLINSYRESAAFLTRSAEELEQIVNDYMDS